MAKRKTDEELLAEEAEALDTDEPRADEPEAPKEVKLDELPESGFYVVDGRKVDPDGKPIKN